MSLSTLKTIKEEENRQESSQSPFNSDQEGPNFQMDEDKNKGADTF